MLIRAVWINTICLIRICIANIVTPHFTRIPGFEWANCWNVELFNRRLSFFPTRVPLASVPPSMQWLKFIGLHSEKYIHKNNFRIAISITKYLFVQKQRRTISLHYLTVYKTINMWSRETLFERLQELEKSFEYHKTNKADLDRNTTIKWRWFIKKRYALDTQLFAGLRLLENILAKSTCLMYAAQMKPLLMFSCRFFTFSWFGANMLSR